MSASRFSTLHMGEDATRVLAGADAGAGTGGHPDADLHAEATPTVQDTHVAARRTRAAATEQTPGVVMDRYHLGKRLGSGAFGTVWSAHDERLDRDVAVKVLPRERVIHARFEREARAAARLQHPAIVTLYEAAVDDDGAYLVSELVRGKTLDQLLAAGKLSDRDVLEIGAALCDALDHAHHQGVIHRDVKPSNVLVPNRAGGGRAGGTQFADRAKLTDFGVAHVVGDAALTHTGDVIGTASYMAPEQAAGDADVGPEADLYSLALVLYEALSGVNPQADARRARRGRVFVPPLRRQRRDLHRELTAGIDRALQPRPQERGTLLELRTALLRASDCADETRGVVAGWRGHEATETLVQDEPGPEWRNRERGHDAVHPDTAEHAVPQIRISGVGGPLAAYTAAGLPRTLRAANALAAGLGGAWLWAHLIHHTSVPPAIPGLVAALVALALPALGSLLAAVALGVVSLAGATPAMVAQTGSGWLKRALFAAGGLCVLVAVGRATHHNLYWLPAQLPPHHTRALLALAVWAGAAVLAPMLRLRRFPMLDLLICALWSAAVVVGMGAADARPLAGVIPGAVLGWAIISWQSLLAIVEETRRAAGIHVDVS